MRFAELSRRTGVPAPTLKYYLREGLIPAGRRTKPNQAQYDMQHVRRIRLIKAMQDVCGLSIAAIRDVLTTVDEADGDLHRVLGAGQCGMTASTQSEGTQRSGGTQPPDETQRPEETQPSEGIQRPDAAQHGPRAEAVRLANERGWRVKPDTPALAALTELIDTLYTLEQCDILARLPDYAEIAESLARIDLALVCARSDIDSMVEGVVVGNTLGDALMSALRRLAQESLSAERFGTPERTLAETEGQPCPN